MSDATIRKLLHTLLHTRLRKFLLCTLLVAKAVGAQSTSAAITTADLRLRLKIIADDSMMGRQTGSKGDFITADYIASEFRRLGLRPAGEHGTYFQTVPFWMAAVDTTSRLVVRGTTLQVVRDFLPSNVRSPARTLDGVTVIYGGSATDSDGWIPPAQAAGKVVLLIVPRNADLRGVTRTAVFFGTTTMHRWRPAAAVALDAPKQRDPHAPCVQ